MGTEYKENVYTIFDYHRELQTGPALPADLRMLQGTACQVMVNPRSPYGMVREDGALVLSSATLLLESGVDLRYIQELLRHRRSEAIEAHIRQ